MADPLEGLLAAYRELEVAKSNYERGMIKEKIRGLEAALKENPIGPVQKEQKVSKVIAIEDTQRTIDSVFLLKDTSERELKVEEEYDTARIENITRCNIHIRTAHSAHISHAKDSVLYITAQQIRVYSCSNLTIYAYTATGVFIEDSVEIRVCEYTPEVRPSYENRPIVYSFNAESTI
ncbi:hypothetical protein NEAUS07_0888 [Nematocida ausubeli]|nr:hypothetical protein NEAUS07_0888 [Nematocida ausubeli]